MFDKKDTDKDSFLGFDEFQHGRNEKFLQNTEKFSNSRHKPKRQSFTRRTEGWLGRNDSKQKEAVFALKVTQGDATPCSTRSWQPSDEHLPCVTPLLPSI